MTDLTNYLMPPQEPNMLAYDDTQGMRSRPADPLRWAADWIGQNKDLPAPQFFMDPRALSARNMLHSALNTSANWLDGTRDPSAVKVGPDTLAPLGLAGFGMGAAPKAAVASRVVNSIAEPQTIRAYHGSPHKFDKFDSTKINSGEGAQSYGHGIYLAEQEAVARSYRDALSKPGGGHMYEVDIKGKTDDFLDWDKPIAQQSEAIRAAFPQEMHGLTGEQLHRELAKMIRAENPRQSLADTSFTHWKDPTQGVQKSIAERLKQAGIPGIRYLDQDSRSVGSGTSNYVLFDDGLAKINRIYADNARSSAPGTVVNSIAEQPQTIRAYHGSPHDFDRFSMDRIGTGEGSQAFGRGLYFAESPQTAAAYRPPGGRSYEVGIRGKPDEFLDLDAPMSAQPQQLRDTMLRVAQEEMTRKGWPESYQRQMLDDIVGEERMQDAFSRFTGLFHRADQPDAGDALAAQALAGAGIKGTRFLDAGSREAGQGTRNYVVFDDSLVDINRKYARPGDASAPGLAANSTQQQDDQGVMSILKKYGLAD